MKAKLNASVVQGMKLGTLLPVAALRVIDCLSDNSLGCTSGHLARCLQLNQDYVEQTARRLLKSGLLEKKYRQFRDEPILETSYVLPANISEKLAALAETATYTIAPVKG
jgi:hypothetical protein